MRTTTPPQHDPATPHLAGPSIDSTTTAVALLLPGGREVGTGHTMLSRADVWHHLTARFVGAIAAGTPIETVGIDVDDVQSTRAEAA